MSLSLSVPVVGQPNSTEAPKIAADFTAIQTWANALPPAANPVNAAVSYTASPGDVANAAPGVTVTLPGSPTNGSEIVVYANTLVTGTSPVTVARGGSSLIFGEGFSTSGATSFLLGAQGAFVRLVSISGNWLIVAGQQDTGWVFPALAGSWPTVSGQSAPSYRQIGDRVYLRGGVTNGTGITNHFTMTVPSPAFTQVLLLPVAFAASTVTISTGGGALSTANVTSGQQVNLDGLNYSMS